MKILILNENRHNSIGGIEKYTNNLINIFSNKVNTVYEYSLNINPERIDMFEANKNVIALNVIKRGEKLNLIQKRKRFKLGIKEIEKIEHNFDIVINQIANAKWSKKIYNSKRWIYVQHFNPDFYKQKYIAGLFFQPIIYFGMWLVGIKNPFKKFKNLVFFSEDDKNKLNKERTINYAIIPLASYKKEEIILFQKEKNEKEKDFIYFGRINKEQKQCHKIYHFFNKNKLSIDIYGFGKTEIFKKDKYVKYKGYIENNNINNIIKKYKYSVLFSKYEGFPYSVVESLSNGIPVISTNNCPSIKWLLKDKGIIFNRKTFLNDFKIIDYSTLENNCFNFAKEFLTMEKFYENWNKFIIKIINS